MKQSYRPDIDGLRAVAVIDVLLFHYFPELLPGGFVGVDIFFVISGFLISGIVISDLNAHRFSFADFYARRIRRIFPSLTIVLAVCLALGWVLLLNDEYRLLAEHTVAGSLFASNIALWKEAGYFDAASDLKPLLHLWSLGIEEQFYFLWPVCLLFLWKFPGRRRVMIVVAAALASLALSTALVYSQPISTFYFPFTRFGELLIGCLLALVDWSLPGVRIRRWAVSARAVSSIVSALGLALILVSTFIFDRHSAFPGWRSLLPTLGAAAIILAGCTAWPNKSILQWPAMTLIGLISYPLYLWHWPLLAFSNILLKPTATFRLVLALVSIGLAWITWQVVELTVRRRARAGRSDVPLILCCLSLCCACGAALFLTNGAARWRPQYAAYAGLAQDIVARHGDSGCAGVPKIGFCSQSKPGAPDAAIVGDSHAARLFSGMAAADVTRNWIGLGVSACPPVLGILADTCGSKMQPLLEHVAEAKSIKVVVLAFYGYYTESTIVSSDQFGRTIDPARYKFVDPEDRGASKGDALFAGLSAAVRMLHAHGKRVVVVIDNPELPFFPRGCVQRGPFPPRDQCSVTADEVALRQAVMRQIISRLRIETPSIGVFDTNLVVCPRTPCTPVSPAFSYYEDGNHLSERGSELVARSLLAVL